MGKKDRGNFHRKRAQKIAKQKVKKSREQRGARQKVPLEYTGSRYHAARYVMPLMAAELGIRSANQTSGHKLLDSDARGALAAMVKHLHSGPQDVLESLVQLRQTPVDSAAQQQVITGIVDEWLAYFVTNPPLPRADLVGILRTLAHSLELRTEMRHGGRGYLNHLDEFLPAAIEALQRGSAADIVEWYGAGEDEDDDDDYDDDELDTPDGPQAAIGHLFDDRIVIDVRHRSPPSGHAE